MCLILDITRNFVLDKGKGRDERRAFPIQDLQNGCRR